MGTVYEARHRSQNQRVALKMLPGTFAPGAHELERFATEAEALTRLQHPHIVRIHEVGLHQSQPFIAFELIEGGTLAERLRQGSPPAAQASVALVATLAWAVAGASAIPQMMQTRQRLLDDAVAFYTDLIASNPNNSQVYYERGELYRRIGKTEQSRDDYRKAVECDPDNAEALGELGLCLMNLGEKDEIVLPYLQRAQELSPTSRRSYLWLTWFYEARGRPEDEAAVYRQAAEHYPAGSAEAYLYLAQACRVVSDYRAAKENFAKCLSLTPVEYYTHSDAYRGLGRVHSALGEDDQAVAAFNKALDFPRIDADTLQEIYMFRGNVYIRQKNYAAAVSNYNTAIALGTLSFHYKRRGLAHFYLQHYEQALADIAKAVELRPDDLSSLWWIPLEDVASCPDERFRTGWRALFDKTNEFFKSKPDAPGIAGWHNYLAWLLTNYPSLKLGDPGQAVAHAQKAVELAPGSGSYWNTLGVAQYRNGDWKAAIEALMKSVQLDKRHDSFNFFFLAMAHWQLGEKDKARAWYDQAVTWMDKNRPQDAELKRFRAEATALLGLAKAAQTPNKKD
jgi:tetratricopeptide (TPR) repeat protein